MCKIALITPLKNEIDSITRFLKSIKNQSVPIHYLLVLENDSTDGSEKLLSKIKKLKNVKHFEVINLKMENKAYQLGIKYSSVLKKGIDYLKNERLDIYNELDTVGILDADSFPEKRYYEKLIKNLYSNNQIGLVGGVLYLDNGISEKKSDEHIRGSGRLWKKEAFEDCDYKVGISADANSLIRTKLAGWDVKQVKSAKFYSRPANSRISLEYAGESAYYNGFSLTYVTFKVLNYLIRDPAYSIKFIKGYYRSFKRGEPKNPDKKIVNYNKKRLRNKIKERYTDTLRK